MDTAGRPIDPKTGEILDPKEWIVTEWDGQFRKVKRLSDKQLAFIESLEYQLGYKPKNHQNMPAYKANQLITRLQAVLDKRPPTLI